MGTVPMQWTRAILLAVCIVPSWGITARLSIQASDRETTEEGMNQGTAYPTGLTITVMGDTFGSPAGADIPSPVKQQIVDSMVAWVDDVGVSAQPDGFNAHKPGLLDTTNIAVTSTQTLRITFKGVLDFDIDVNEWVNITLPDAVLTNAASGAVIVEQIEPILIQVSTGTIVIAKLPYELAVGQAASHTMTEADARSDKPSFYLALSPWENWKQDPTVPAGITNVATNCTVSNRPSLQWGWDARVKQGYLMLWNTAVFKQANGEYLKLGGAYNGWRYAEVFITPDPDYDTHIRETIQVDRACVAPYLGSGLEPNPDVKLSFDIVPTPGRYWVETNMGSEIWETTLSMGVPCSWQGVSSSQVANPIPFCDYDRSVSKPGVTPSTTTFPDFVVTVRLDKGETWLTDTTARAELLNSFGSRLGTDFVNHKTDFLDVARLTYPDPWTAVFTVLTWPKWSLAKRQAEVYDATDEENVELDVPFRAVRSTSASLAPRKHPAGSGKPAGFTIKPAPGWLIGESNTPGCSAQTTQTTCTTAPLCKWEDWQCVSKDPAKRDLIFTETEIRQGGALITLKWGSAPGYKPDGTAVGDRVLRPPDGSTTESWCTRVLPTATVTSSANKCTKALDHTDVRTSATSTSLVSPTGQALPTWWNARETTLLSSTAVSITPQQIVISLSQDRLYEIWDVETVIFDIPPYTALATGPVMTSSGLVPLNTPLNITILPDFGVLTVKHATLAHSTASIDFTEDQVRAGIGTLRLTWEGEMWRDGCCTPHLRAGGPWAGGAPRMPPGGLRLMSHVSAVDNPSGWNARMENDTELLPQWRTLVTDIPQSVTGYGRTVELQFLPDFLYDTKETEHVTISISGDAVVSGLDYRGVGWPKKVCPPAGGCSNFVINIIPSSGKVRCLGGANDGVCPDLTERDIREGGRTITIELLPGETWNRDIYPSPWKRDLIGHMNSPSLESFGFQARKAQIVQESGITVDFDNSSRVAVITLRPDPLFDLVNVASEEVRIELFASSTASSLILTPQTLRFNILRAAALLDVSVCLGTMSWGRVGDPSPTVMPRTSADADCATGNRANVTQVWDVESKSYVQALVIHERDLREADVSLRLQLECGEGWVNAGTVAPASRQKLIKDGIFNLPSKNIFLDDVSINTDIEFPPSSKCPQTVVVRMRRHPTFDISKRTLVKLQFPSTLFSSGIAPAPSYLLLHPFPTLVSLNVRRGNRNTAGEPVEPNEGLNSVFLTYPGPPVDIGKPRAPEAEGVIDETVIRTGGLRLNLTFAVGETWAATPDCEKRLLATFEGQLNPNQEGGYKDPNAWGPGADSVHNTALGKVAGGSIVKFSGRTALVALRAVPEYDISVPQNITLDVPAECTASKLRPWWDDVARETYAEYSVTLSVPPGLTARIEDGDFYTRKWRVPEGGEGIPGRGWFSVVPAPGSMRLQAVDGRGCSGQCILPAVRDIEIADREVRSGSAPRLRLILEGETWAVASDAVAGASCTPPSAGLWCLSAPEFSIKRPDVCDTTAATCDCSITTPPACCAVWGGRCDGSAPSPTPTSFNFKSLLWYSTFVPSEDWPKAPATGGGTLAAAPAALIPSTRNPGIGFTARKDTVFPPPTITPAVTSVTLVDPRTVEIAFAADANFRLNIDEEVFILPPPAMVRSGLAPNPEAVNFSFVVTPPVVTLGPKSAFTEKEIRAGVVLTLSLDTGCWAREAEPLLVSLMSSDRSVADEPRGWNAMTKGPAEKVLFVNGNATGWVDPYPPGCRREIYITINATDNVPVEDAYDIWKQEVVTVPLTSAMVESTATPTSFPSPLTITITPHPGEVAIVPDVFFEYNIKTCLPTQPELVIRLFGETWLHPYAANTGLVDCIIDAMDSVNFQSAFDTLKRDTNGHALLDPSAIYIRNPWEAVIPINCTEKYNSIDPEIVFVDLPGRCLRSGLRPTSSTGPSPPRFQIEIESASSVALMDRVIMEEDLRSGSPCVNLILVGPGPHNDTWLWDAPRILNEMVSNRGGVGWELGFNARKGRLLHPSNVRILNQQRLASPAPPPGDPDRPKLEICFRTDPEFQIDAEEVVTIHIRGTAVLSGLAPNYHNNELLQVVIKPSPGNVTITPDVFTEDEIRDGGQVVSLIMEYGEKWAFNPAGCFIGGVNANCQPAFGPPTRAMCECVKNARCDTQTSTAQPWGWNTRFGQLVTSSGFRFRGQSILELTLRSDRLFDITEDQWVRVEIPGCATKSGLPTQPQYIRILRTPGKVTLVEQLPPVGSDLPCGYLCKHNRPLEFTEKDIRNGSVSLLFRVDGDLWLNRPVDLQLAFRSSCPPSPTLLSNSLSCPDGFEKKRVDIIPTGSFSILPSSNARLLRVDFTAVPTYNLDVDEEVCIFFPASAMASKLPPVVSVEHERLFMQSMTCFNITAVNGSVSIQTDPPRICESHLRLGQAAFTLILEEEFWNDQAAAFLISYITGNQTCDVADTQCLATYDQTRTFAGQKVKGGLIPVLPGGNRVDTSKVVFLDGPAPYYTQLYFPFPDKPQVTTRPQPWYDISENELIKVVVIGESTTSGLWPEQTQPVNFTIHASTLRTVPSEVVFTEQQIRNGSSVSFLLELDCDTWNPGSEVLITKAFTAAPLAPPLPNTGWNGRSGNILRLDFVSHTTLRVTLLADPEYDICITNEEIAIDFSAVLTHYTSAEVGQIFASRLPPTPQSSGGPVKYQRGLLANDDPSAYFKFTIANVPGTATMSLWKRTDGDWVECPHPCTFTEDEIRRGVGAINITLSDDRVGWSDPSALVLGFNSSNLDGEGG
eukprot:Sspe_Gene.12616::Locus_4306_Transcript_1_1_Confidence_1.000_Length_8422::g.12616::m.12616